MNRKTLGALFISIAASPAVFAQTFVCPTGGARPAAGRHDGRLARPGLRASL